MRGRDSPRYGPLRYPVLYHNNGNHNIVLIFILHLENHFRFRYIKFSSLTSEVS
jgi:hypothetical protein